MYTFHHRKLINDTVEDYIFKLCQSYCDPSDDGDGSCPIQCLTRCYPICNHAILIDTPPPPPTIFISYDDDPQARSHKLSIFFTLSLAVLAATFVLFSLYTAYKFYKRGYILRRNQLPSLAQPQEEAPIREFFLDQDIGSVVDHPVWYIRTVGLQPAVISSIATFKYKLSDGLIEGTDCSVCLSEFDEDEILRLLPKCEHAFHIACIDTWLRSHTNCPLCRAPVVITTANANSQSTDHRPHSLSNVVESQIEENRTSERQVEIEVPQLSIRMNDEYESRVEIDLTRHSREDDGSSGSQELGEKENEVHLIRRSVSMDSLTASAINAAIANAVRLRSDRNLAKQLVETTTTGSTTPKEIDHSLKDLNSVCSSSIEPKGPSFMAKRSLSCSAKVFLSRYSRGKISTPPPPPLP